MDVKESTVTELTEKKDWLKAFSVMQQLRVDLTEGTYLHLLAEMRKDGYRLFGLKVENELVALCGFAICVNFYNKRHVFVYDLVTDKLSRSLGYGEILLEFTHNWAKENDAEYVALESGIPRTEAHRFYEQKFDYDKWCYSFRKELS